MRKFIAASFCDGPIPFRRAIRFSKDRVAVVFDSGAVKFFYAKR